MSEVKAGTTTTKPNLVDLTSLNSTRALRNYKRSVIEPKGVEFNKRQTEYQLFPEEYFTGTDCYVYFNDVWLDELTGLSFSLTENVAPIHGYASNIWDYVARGKRFVQGQFRIAFKEAGYMFAILDHIGKLGDTKKSAISWLLNDTSRDLYNDGKYRGIDGVPDGYADVLENIEDALGRIYGDKSAKAAGSSHTEKFRWEFEWNLPLKLGSPNTKMKEARTSSKQWGQVSQLQQRLIDLGFGFPDWNPGWSKYYRGDTWTSPSHSAGASSSITNVWQSRTGKKVTTSSGDWYVGVRFWPETTNKHHKNRSINGVSSKSHYEMQLQERLQSYPGDNATLWMGSPDGKVQFDGRYGSGPLAGIQLFQKLAGINDGSKGYFVTSETYSALRKGLHVNGDYDVATRVAVWLFQQKQIDGKNTYHIKEANGIVDLETRKALAEDAERTVVTPGENRFKPGEMAEPLYAVYEKEVWGRPFVDKADAAYTNESFFYRSRRNDDGELNLASLWQDGFDIYINYGPLPQYIQNKLNKIPDVGSFNTTIKAIRNVQLTNVQQVLDANTGQPIEEIYSFIARDLD